MINVRKITAVAASLTLSFGFANAGTITSPTQLPNSVTTVGFENLVVGTAEPLTFGNMTISSSTSNRSVQAQGFTQIAGIFEGQYFGFGISDYRFDFVQSVGIFGTGIFDPNVTGTRLVAFDVNDNVLETYTAQLAAPGGTFSDFGGFIRAQNDISYVWLLGGENDALGVDNVSFGMVDPSPVPLPAAGLLFGGALVGSIWRRAAKSASA